MPDYRDATSSWGYDASRSLTHQPAHRGFAPNSAARPASEQHSPMASEQPTDILGCLLGAALAILLLVGGGIWLGSSLATTLGEPATGPEETYVLASPPTVSADFINQVLARYHSPAAGLGQVIYDDGIKYGIDPVFALAFFMHESSFGTTGEARSSLSIGNLRCLGVGYQDLHPRCRDNFAWFPSWADGIEAWYRLIKVGYIEGGINAALGGNACPCTTVAQIVPIYAPGSDHNDEAAYIAAVDQEVQTWRNGQVWVG